MLNIEQDGFVSLLRQNGEVRQALRLPIDLKELKVEIKDYFDADVLVSILVIKAMGEEKIIGVKELVSM